MTDPTTERSPVDDIVELVNDIGQYLQWQQLGGADALPVEPRLSDDARKAILTAPAVAPTPRAAPVARTPAAAPATPKQPSLGNWGRYTQSEPRQTVVGALDRASSLSAIRSELGDCQRCGLCRGRRNIVFGVGSETADLMVIGEGPGANEDRQGEPFIGKAGQMLDRMLENVLGLPRPQVYISNVVKCRPPGNRNPEPDEIARCRPFLLAQMRVIQPKVVLVLGSVAGRTMFDTGMGITRLRGSWRTVKYPGGEARAMPTFHPAYLLRQASEKRKTFEDLKAVRTVLAELSS